MSHTRDNNVEENIHFGSDTGGTFTDIVVLSGNGVSLTKVPSSRQDPSAPVIGNFLQQRFPEHSRTYFSHGTTVATNALLEGKVARTAFITTKGFKDLLTLGRQNREKLYALVQKPGAHLIDPQLTFEINERTDRNGRVVTEISRDDLEKLSEELHEKNVESVAVSFLFSFLNGDNEKKTATFLRNKGFTVSISSEISPIRGEYERSCATAINGMLLPVIKNYTHKILHKLPLSAFTIMGSRGNAISANEAALRSVETVLSGPAAGVSAAADVGRLIGESNVVTIDMGGTSTDVAVIAQHSPCYTNKGKIRNWPLCISTIDIETVGAGGGSIARLDDGGLLRSGPESAGAIPGPACYDRGGKLPTVTDAQVVLGRLNPRWFSNSSVTLNVKAALKAVSELSSTLNQTCEETALEIIQVTESSMERALRKITLTRGFDPRNFSLMCFGGAAPLHCCSLIKNLNMKKGIIPPWPGALCAIGAITSPKVNELVVSRPVTCGINGETIPVQEISRIFSHLELQCKGTMKTYVRVSFKGQLQGIVLPWNRDTEPHLRMNDFFSRHREEIGFVHEDREIEITEIICEDTIPSPVTLETILKQTENSHIQMADIDGTKESVIYNDGVSRQTRLYNRSSLATDKVIAGPAIIIDPTSTILIEQKFTATALESGAILVHFNDQTKSKGDSH